MVFLFSYSLFPLHIKLCFGIPQNRKKLNYKVGLGVGTETIRPVSNFDGTGRIGTKMLSRTDIDTECKNLVRVGFVSFNTE